MTWVDLTSASLVLSAYLIGSIPTAYLAVRFLKGQDIRRLGDGNAGAANASRILGQRMGVTVGAIDIAKGAVAVLLVRVIVDSTPAEMIAGAAAVAGHTWPVYLQLRGGRGAATGLGVLMAMLPVLAIPVSLVALALLYWTKSTMKALSFLFISLGLLAWPVGYSYPLIAYALGIPVAVGATHYLSLRRMPPPELRSGEQT